jgi:hypothetical protein
MRTRWAFEICLPLALFVAACALSFPPPVIAFVWMTIGVVSRGHRTLDSFPTDGILREWRKGCRGACLWLYHFAWWPWYMKVSSSNLHRSNRADSITNEKFAASRLGDSLNNGPTGGAGQARANGAREGWHD